MESRLVRLIWQRAARSCEYCRMPQECDDISFEIDHIIARKHGGTTTADNLALSCFWCNAFKGSNIAGLDPKTDKLTSLFHPRRHRWTLHFRWKGAWLTGRTPIRRTTIAVLNINDPFRIELRETLMEEGIFTIT